MVAIKESVQSLSARLPELAWKLSARYSVLNPKLLPRGLFNPRLEMTPQSCINEINEDLRLLSGHKNERSSHYLAGRVSQKINVLVRLCQMPAEKQPSTKPLSFGVQTISTRQQWLGTLEEDISTLTTQQLALTATLNKIQISLDPEAILSLKAEIGEVERRLTLAQETLSRATRT